MQPIPTNHVQRRGDVFTVDDIEELLARLRKHGAQHVGEVVPCEDLYWLCCIDDKPAREKHAQQERCQREKRQPSTGARQVVAYLVVGMLSGDC